MKRVKSQIILVTMDMFSQGVVILMTENDESLYEELIRKLIKPKKEDMDDWKECYRENNDADGFTFTDRKHAAWQIIVFMDREGCKGTLVHETLHVVERLCEHRNIPITKDTEELRAMMLGHIFMKVHEVIKV
jgi:hypothetical protein